jgi:hypothetical protein
VAFQRFEEPFAEPRRFERQSALPASFIDIEEQRPINDRLVDEAGAAGGSCDVECQSATAQKFRLLAHRFA